MVWDGLWNKRVWASFLKFLWTKYRFKFFFENISGSAQKSYSNKGKQKSKKNWKAFFMGGTPVFFRAKNLSVKHEGRDHTSVLLSMVLLRLGLERSPPKPPWSDGPVLCYSTIKAEGQVFEKDSWSLAHETDQWHHYVQDWLRHNIAYEIVFTYLQCVS